MFYIQTIVGFFLRAFTLYIVPKRKFLYYISVFLFQVAIGDFSQQGLLQVYNQNLELVYSFQAHDNAILRIKQLPNGYVATCSYDCKVKIWNPLTWTSSLSYADHKNNLVYALEYLNSDLMASGDNNGTVKIWNMHTGETIKTFNLSSDVYALKVLSNNSLNLAIGLSNGIIQIYDLSRTALITNLAGHTSIVDDLITINTDLLASSSRDNTVKLWNLTTNTLKFTLRAHASNVYGLKLVSSEILASGSQDSTIKIWNITNGTLLRTLTGHTSPIWMSVDLVSSEKLVSGSRDLTIKLWNISTSECLQTVKTSLSIRSLAVLNASLTATTQKTTNTSKLFKINKDITLKGD